MIYDLQKASLLKRVSAFILDAILVCILAVGVATVMSGVLDYDSYYERMSASYEKYATEYNTDFNISQEDFNAMTEEEQQRYKDALAALNADEEALTVYNMLIYLSLIIATVSLLVAILVLEFAVPLLFGNGRTVGKKIFTLAVIKTNGVRVNAVSLFIRALLGKFTIETMIPMMLIMMMFWGGIGIVGPIVILGILVIQVVLMVTSHTNSMIHDTLAQTVVVDFHSQMIFDSESELIEFKKRTHEEYVSKQTY